MKAIKNILGLAMVLLVLAGSFSSCAEDEEPTTSIIGKWKLVKVTSSFTSIGPISFDYSQYNILYEFKVNDILTVSGKTDNIDNYMGHEIGEHSYSIIDEDKGYDRLTIDGQGWGHQISSNELIISLAFLDGPIYDFVKIK